MDRPIIDLSPRINGSLALPILEWKRDHLHDRSVMEVALASIPRLTSAELGPIPLGYLRTALASAQTLIGLQIKFSGIPIMPLVSVPLSGAFQANLRSVFDSWIVHRLAGNDLALLTYHEHLLRGAAVAIHWAEGDPGLSDETLPVWLESSALVLPASITSDPAAFGRAQQLASERQTLQASGFSRGEAVELLAAMMTARWITPQTVDEGPAFHPLAGAWQLETPLRVESTIPLLGETFTIRSVTFTVPTEGVVEVTMDRYRMKGELEEASAVSWRTQPLTMSTPGTTAFEVSLDSGFQAGDLTLHFQGFKPESASSRIARV